MDEASSQVGRESEGVTLQVCGANDRMSTACELGAEYSWHRYLAEA